MHILVSNDDGYRAPGIQALAQAMRRFGRVTVVAPDHNHSGASNSLTLNRPLTVEHQDGDSLYVLSGTPSDCVHVALTGLLPKPDLVVSGINCGANMGDDTMYSGTVAAAIEGYLFGVPSIAFSQIDKGWAELDSAAKIAQLVVERYLESREDERAVLLNVNMPNMPVAGKPADAEEGTDFWATSHGYVSVTPLQVDLTNYKQVPTVRGWMDGPAV